MRIKVSADVDRIRFDWQSDTTPGGTVYIENYFPGNDNYIEVPTYKTRKFIMCAEASRGTGIYTYETRGYNVLPAFQP